LLFWLPISERNKRRKKKKRKQNKYAYGLHSAKEEEGRRSTGDCDQGNERKIFPRDSVKLVESTTRPTVSTTPTLRRQTGRGTAAPRAKLIL